MKAYSLDLREKLVERYETGGISQRELARQFGVSLFFVEKILGLKRRGMSLAPRIGGGTVQPKLTAEMRSFVRETLEGENDLILPELCDRVTKRFAVEVSPPTMCRAVGTMNLRRKKRVSTLRSVKASA
jgi:transposase